MGITMPCVVTDTGGVKAVYMVPASFTGPNGVQHSAAAWVCYTAEDWARFCPGWKILPLIDTPPTDVTKLWIRNPPSAWAIAADAIHVTYAGTAREPVLVEVDLTAAIARDVQAWMDAAVRPRRYDSILAACTYATSTNPTYAAEGQACVSFRDDVWAICFALLDDVKQGKGPVMTSAEVIAELPPLVWPDEVAVLA